jgi:dipeptidyl aminopeptidase/acylaminoacyl peptidase
MATDVASTGADVRALVAISGGEYDPLVTRLRAPVLLLHGKRDDVVSVEYAIEYAAALRAAGKRVELVLYDHGDHFLPFRDPAISEDVHSRVVRFLRGYLPP